MSHRSFLPTYGRGELHHITMVSNSFDYFTRPARINSGRISHDLGCTNTVDLNHSETNAIVNRNIGKPACIGFFMQTPCDQIISNSLPLVEERKSIKESLQQERCKPQQRNLLWISLPPQFQPMFNHHQCSRHWRHLRQSQTGGSHQRHGPSPTKHL